MLRVPSCSMLVHALRIARAARPPSARQASSSAAGHVRSASAARPALLQLKDARLPPPAAAAAMPVSLTISDAPDCWAIVGGDGDGERVVEALRDVSAGRGRPAG